MSFFLSQLHTFILHDPHLFCLFPFLHPPLRVGWKEKEKGEEEKEKGEEGEGEVEKKRNKIQL
jgi:hypothetical protein